MAGTSDSRDARAAVVDSAGVVVPVGSDGRRGALAAVGRRHQVAVLPYGADVGRRPAGISPDCLDGGRLSVAERTASGSFQACNLSPAHGAQAITRAGMPGGGSAGVVLCSAPCSAAQCHGPFVAVAVQQGPGAPAVGSADGGGELLWPRITHVQQFLRCGAGCMLGAVKGLAAHRAVHACHTNL